MKYSPLNLNNQTLIREKVHGFCRLFLSAILVGGWACSVSAQEAPVRTIWELNQTQRVKIENSPLDTIKKEQLESNATEPSKMIGLEPMNEEIKNNDRKSLEQQKTKWRRDQERWVEEHKQLRKQTQARWSLGGTLSEEEAVQMDRWLDAFEKEQKQWMMLEYLACGAPWWNTVGKDRWAERLNEFLYWTPAPQRVSDDALKKWIVESVQLWIDWRFESEWSMLNLQCQAILSANTNQNEEVQVIAVAPEEARDFQFTIPWPEKVPIEAYERWKIEEAPGDIHTQRAKVFGGWGHWLEVYQAQSNGCRQQTIKQQEQTWEELLKVEALESLPLCGTAID